MIKLQPCICVSGVYVFYDGEAGNKMYFVKHGMAEVLKNHPDISGHTIAVNTKMRPHFAHLHVFARGARPPLPRDGSLS